MKNIACIVILVFILSVGKSQNRKSASANNGWYMYFGNHKVSESLFLHTEYQWRRTDIITQWQQSLARIGLDYSVNDNFIITAGYGFITSWPYGDQPVAYVFDEHRVWQQMILKNTISRFYLNHRYRMEQRWIGRKANAAPGEYTFVHYAYQNRVRYRLMATIPITKKELTDNTWFAGVYSETFISFGKNVAKNIFDQHRLYGALGFWFSKKTNVQLGYMYHTLVKSDAVHIENNNTLQLALTHNFDFTSSAK